MITGLRNLKLITIHSVFPQPAMWFI